MTSGSQTGLQAQAGQVPQRPAARQTAAGRVVALPRLQEHRLGRVDRQETRARRRGVAAVARRKRVLTGLQDGQDFPRGTGGSVAGLGEAGKIRRHGRRLQQADEMFSLRSSRSPR